MLCLMMCCMAGWDANHYNPGVIIVYVQIFEACNFQDFHDQLAIRKLSFSKFYWQNFDLHQSESRILVNSYTATFDTCK